MQAPKTRSGPSRTAQRPGGERNRRHLLAGSALVVVVVVAIVLGVVLSQGSSKAKPALSGPIDWAGMPGLQNGPPPWGANGATLADRLPALGLSQLTGEQLAFHIHQHLDLYVNGRHVGVPAHIGFAANGSFLTEIHTHDPTGIIHVESARHLDYVLGQFFGEWGVRLTASCVGRYCGQLSWWVNGRKQVGNPAELVLKPHQEIVIAAGAAPKKIPSSYDFPPGY